MNALDTNMLRTFAVEWSSIGLMGLTVLFLFACLLLILVVLIQRPQGGGLAGAFGSGAGSGQTAFGTRTGDALTVATIGLFVFYLATAVGLTYFVQPKSAPVVEKQVETAPAQTTPTPAAAPGEGAAGAKALDDKPAGATNDVSKPTEPAQAPEQPK